MANTLLEEELADRSIQICFLDDLIFGHRAAQRLRRTFGLGVSCLWSLVVVLAMLIFRLSLLLLFIKYEVIYIYGNLTDASIAKNIPNIKYFVDYLVFIIVLRYICFF